MRDSDKLLNCIYPSPRLAMFSLSEQMTPPGVNGMTNVLGTSLLTPEIYSSATGDWRRDFNQCKVILTLNESPAVLGGTLQNRRYPTCLLRPIMYSSMSRSSLRLAARRSAPPIEDISQSSLWYREISCQTITIVIAYRPRRATVSARTKQTAAIRCSKVPLRNEDYLAYLIHCSGSLQSGSAWLVYPAYRRYNLCYDMPHSYESMQDIVNRIRKLR